MWCIHTDGQLNSIPVYHSPSSKEEGGENMILKKKKKAQGLRYGQGDPSSFTITVKNKLGIGSTSD